MDKFLLIEKVREHEVLYNHKSPEYRNHHVRQAAWEEIGRELQIPGNNNILFLFYYWYQSVLIIKCFNIGIYKLYNCSRSTP